MWRSVLGLLAFPFGEGLAYKPAGPTRHDVISDNGAHVLDVNPKSERLTIFAAGRRTQPLWSFGRSVWQEKHFVSDNGKVVAVVTWRYVQVNELDHATCIEFWNKRGKFREYKFAELCPNPARLFWESGPVGSFWRKWYSVADSNENILRVRTTDQFEYRFSLDDGRILETKRIALPWWAWVLVATLGVGMAITLVTLRSKRAGNA